MNPAATRNPPGAPRGTAVKTDLNSFLDILFRNSIRIGLTTLASLMLAILYLATTTPLYTANTTLFIDPRAKKVLTEEPGPAGFGSDLAMVESQVSILASDAVLGRVVERLKLYEDLEFAPPARTGLLS